MRRDATAAPSVGVPLAALVGVVGGGVGKGWRRGGKDPILACLFQTLVGQRLRRIY